MKKSFLTGTTKFRRIFAIAIIFCSTNRVIVDGQDETNKVWGSYMGYPAICDREYRTKYFHDDAHRQAVRDGSLYEPPGYRNDDAARFFFDSDENNDESSDYFDPDDDNANDTDHGDYLTNFEDGDGDDDDDDENYFDFMDTDDTSLGDIFNWRNDENNYSDDRQEFNDFFKYRGTRQRIDRYRGSRNVDSEIGEIGNPTIGTIGNLPIGNLFLKKCFKETKVDNSMNNGRDDERDGFGKIGDTSRMQIWKGRRGDVDERPKIGGKSRSRRKGCEASRRIVGGRSVESAEVLPYMAFVDSGCGGAIIGESWVITAGHCVDNDEPRYVHVGGIKLLTGCQYNVDYIYVHPHFSRKNLDNDVALLRIIPNFVYSPAIQPIPLSNAKAARKSCGVVAGWGAEEYKGAPRIVLSITTIPVVSRRGCKKFGIKKGQFCAGYEDARSDACQGDSGGPFAVDDVLVGIVSYGYKCARPNTPGVYVDVFHHRDWIHAITGF